MRCHLRPLLPTRPTTVPNPRLSNSRSASSSLVTSSRVSLTSALGRWAVNAACRFEASQNVQKKHPAKHRSVAQRAPHIAILKAGEETSAGLSGEGSVIDAGLAWILNKDSVQGRPFADKRFLENWSLSLSAVFREGWQPVPLQIAQWNPIDRLFSRTSLILLACQMLPPGRTRREQLRSHKRISTENAHVARNDSRLIQMGAIHQR
jgi:hypothetical protein